MRILILPSWYPTARRPVNGIFIREQADALHAEHAVRVLYLDVLPRGARRRARRWTTHRRGYVEEFVEVPNPPGLWQFFYLWYFLRAWRRLRREFRPDVLHGHI